MELLHLVERNTRHESMGQNRLLALALTAFVVAALGATDTQAGSQTSATVSPEAVQSGVYALEPVHTQIVFSVLHLGFTNYYGVFSRASGELKLNPASLAATSLSVTVPTDSVMTTSADLNDKLKGDQWFDVDKYPTMQFRSSRVTQTGEKTATVEGELTFHGVTRPMVLSATFIGAGTNPIDKSYALGFSATGVVKRSEYGVKTYAPLIGDDVELTINAAFSKQQ